MILAAPPPKIGIKTQFRSYEALCLRSRGPSLKAKRTSYDQSQMPSGAATCQARAEAGSREAAQALAAEENRQKMLS